jgi:hypothetical protein
MLDLHAKEFLVKEFEARAKKIIDCFLLTDNDDSLVLSNLRLAVDDLRSVCNQIYEAADK